MGTEKTYMESGEPFVPMLTTKDWNEEWMRLQEARHARDDSSMWDKKAESFNKPFGHSPYSKQFVDYADIAPGETVFDMGCGTGAIAIPLAQEGHAVCAADFSDGMLKRLAEEAQKAGVDTIDAVKLSWDDDWASKGIMPDSYDVAVASRSVATSNIKESLMKLSSVARRKCAITVSAGSSPRSDQQILSEIGLQPFIGRDFLYAFMVLVDAGYLPEVRYITSERRDSYADHADAYESLKKMVVDVSYIVPQEQVDLALVNLEGWISDNLVKNPNAGKVNEYSETELDYVLKNPRKIIWAFLSWDVCGHSRL